MKDILRGIKKGDLVEFDLITNPIEIDEVDYSGEHYVRLTFKCHSGYWGLGYKWDGTQLGDETFKERWIRKFEQHL